MRIISGKARGIRLQAPDGLEVRPTADRVKESLFSILGPLAGLRVLDLFAGTGAFGLEALSRGAAEVVLVERQKRNRAIIEANLAAVVKSMHEPAAADRVRILIEDVRALPQRLAAEAGRFDLILADPPYHPPAGEFGGHDLVRSAEFAAWAGPEALLMLEQDGTDHQPPPWFPLAPWRLLDSRRIGHTILYFARQEPATP